MEKTKQRLATSLEDLRGEVERLRSSVAQMEKKQIYFDKIIAEWRGKVNDLQQGKYLK